MNKALDEVRAGESRRIAGEGGVPVLKKSRWLLLKREENLKPEQRFRLRDLLRYNLKTVRAYLLKEALVQSFERADHVGKIAFSDYAPRIAAQVAGIVVGRPGRLPTLNCCFLIFAASSIPLMVTAAVWNRVNPSIGRIRCFTRRWFCSVPLLRYLLERTRTRVGSSA